MISQNNNMRVMLNPVTHQEIFTPVNVAVSFAIFVSMIGILVSSIIFAERTERGN